MTGAVAAPNVLFVDDDKEAAEDYARLIRQRTGLTTAVVDNPTDAIAVVSGGGVSVAVLDQQMPVTVGTELFKQLRHADPKIRAILLTGEATREEIAEAQNIGFKKTLFKAQALSLLEAAVRHEFIEYENATLLDVSITQPVLLRRRKGWIKGSSIAYRFATLEILNDSYIREADWREVLTIQVGESHAIKLTKSETWSLQIEDEVSSRLSASAGLSSKGLATLNTQLQAETTSRLKETKSTSGTTTLELEQRFSLPAEPTDVDQLHVRARRVQQAPVYVEVRIELASDCDCCGRTNFIPIRALVRTSAVALRHVDQMSDGTRRTIDLGQTGRN